MKTTKHTPGPWSADIDAPYASIHEENAPFRLICDFQDTEDPDRQTANARLIAAAPDLLQSLIDCVEEVEAFSVIARSGKPELIATAKRARAAIAKATRDIEGEAKALGFKDAAEAAAHDAWLQEHGTPEFKKWRAGIED